MSLAAALVFTIGFAAGDGKKDEAHIFRGHTDKATSVAVSPDGKRALSGSDDRTVREWDLEKLKPLRVFEEHKNYVLSVAYSRDGERALSAGGGAWRGQEFATESDQFLRLRDVKSGEILKVLKGHTAPVWSVAFTPDGKQALAGSGGYEKKGGKFVPAGYTLKRWDLETGRATDLPGHTSWVRSVAVTDDGKFALSGSWDKTVRLWDVANGKALRTFTGHKDNVDAVAISADGHWGLSGGGPPKGTGDTAIRLWDLTKKAEARQFKGHTARVWSVAFSANGRRALSAAADHLIILWDVETGQEVRRFQGHTDEVRQAVFLPGERQALSASHDRTLRLWNLPQ
jgi:WD40 repeat protein